ncbi:MAG: ribonuclease P protein component [bacterium]|nr:ribonuclease P protein component [bacterium]
MRLNKAGVEAVLKEGRLVHSDNLSLKYLKAKGLPSNPKSHYSFVVSAKTAKLAVTRNLLKRRGRHIVDKLVSMFKAPFDFVFFFKPGATKIDFESLEKEIVVIFKKSGII